MSFVYAEKTNNVKNALNPIVIYCDTKIKLEDNAKGIFSDVEIMNLKRYGMIKTVIASPGLCISFAGNNITLASKLFGKLAQKRKFEMEEAIDIAYSIHMSAEDINDIEFMFCSDDDGFKIDCIKNGEVERNCLSGWIGSELAFGSFQKKRLAFLKEGEAASKYTESTFQMVINEGVDDSVGGFVIKTVYNGEVHCFEYQNRYEFCTEKTQMVALGNQILFYTGAQDGGAAIEYKQIDIKNLLLSINNMKPSILYSATSRIEGKYLDELCGLMMPIEVYFDEKGVLRRLR